MWKYICLIVILSFLGSLASLYLKKAASSKKIAELIRNKYLYIGGILYGSAALMNVYVLRFLDYSVALPLTSITYVWTLALSKYMLGERITKRKLIGVLFIIIGSSFISRTAV